ncbi:MAG: hypothetical protein WC663_03990 [Patescibacteria group bacterium]|jgi:hypothetical protein
MTLHLYAGMGKVGEKEATSCGKNLLVKKRMPVYLNDSKVCQDCLKEGCLAPVADPAMAFEAQRLCVITGTKVVNTGEISFKYLHESGAKHTMISEFFGHYGHVYLREKGENEVDPFKLARGEEGAIGPNGILKWDIVVVKSGHGIVMQGHVDEMLPDERGLMELLKDVPKCTLLMQRDIFDRFENACQMMGIELEVHHFDGELRTS